jgi:hypothetical protein
MKKLKLDSVVFDFDKILTRDQLRNVIGGSGGAAGSCSTTCECPKNGYADGSWTISTGSCAETCSATPKVSVTCGTTTTKCSDGVFAHCDRLA